MVSEPSAQQRYHIGAVAKLTGLSTHTIRVWERRYGAVRPSRSPGGTREYSEEDLQKLRLLSLLTQGGRAIRHIAHLSCAELQSELEELDSDGSDEAPGGAERASDATPMDAPVEERHAQTVGAFLAAIEGLEPVLAERVLVESSTLTNPLDMVFEVVAPIVEKVGDYWAAGRYGVAHEHMATAVLRTFLGTFVSKQLQRDGSPCAVCTTLSGELHELGALMAGFVAVARGWNVLYLGPNLPNEDILLALEKMPRSTLLLSLVNERDADTTKSLASLLESLPPDVRLICGGRSARSYLGILDEDDVVPSLRALYQKLSLRRLAEASLGEDSSL